MTSYDDVFGLPKTVSAYGPLDIQDIVTVNTSNGPRDYSIFCIVTRSEDKAKFFAAFSMDKREFIVLDELGNFINPATDPATVGYVANEIKFFCRAELEERMEEHKQRRQRIEAANAREAAAQASAEQESSNEAGA